MASVGAASAVPSPDAGRIVAIDVLRGATIAAMILVNNPGQWGANSQYAPLRHAEWHGWTPTDLVFPFFLFMVGASIVFALQKRLDAGVPRADLLRKIAVRALALIAVGLFLNAYPIVKFEGGFGWRDGLESLRWPGVLQRIGICYGIVATLFVFCSLRTLAIVSAVCLVGYHVALCWIPVPEFGAGRIDEPHTSVAAWVDQQLLHGHMWASTRGAYDPEGVLSTIPAIATCAFGVFTGALLRGRTRSAESKCLALFVGGSALVVAGSVWNWFLPINKPLWTSSYATLTAGLAMCALGWIAYWTDVRKLRGFVRPFEVYGVNALTVFVMSAILAKTMARIDVTPGVDLKTWIYRHAFLSWSEGRFASLAFALAWVAGWYVVLAWMYRRRIVIKL